MEQPIPSGQRSDNQMLPVTAKPPKSKIAPYYAIHPLWKDIEPIPELDLDRPATYINSVQPLSTETAEKLASAGPALATIAYTPRYTEAMSYLRAVMARVEYSERALALTEDIIGMNPAHYTVWIYRFRVLKEIWGPLWTGDGGDRVVVDDQARLGFETELKWLGKISEKNLKNYQIWHHRNSLFQLLPTSTKPLSSASTWIKSLLDNEPVFLRSILDLDTKNYHVWSYRQWLCAHFSDHYLTNDQELEAMDTMIREDVMNNSAWNHRYFIIFGSKENVKEEKKKQRRSQRKNPSAITIKDNNKDNDNDNDDDSSSLIDLDTVESELEYVKSQIRYAPQNGSSWNYLKGILKYAGIEETELKDFCAEFVGDNFDFDHLDGKAEEPGAAAAAAATAVDETGNDTKQKRTKKGVKSSQAVEMCVAIFAKEIESGRVGSDEEVENAKSKVRAGLEALSTKWDPIRRRYWAWRMDEYEKVWNAS